MRSRLSAINYRAGLARKAMRFEPLGMDLDGRVYYTLTAREIDRDRYRPSFWARGVLIWGRGWREDDDVPALVERWMVVNTAEDIRTLARYIGYRWRTRSDDMREAEEAAKKTPKAKATPRPSLKKTPSKANGVANRYDSDDSELSSPPDDLLELLHPPGYEPSRETVEAEQCRLESNLMEAAMFVEALEWKGIRP